MKNRIIHCLSRIMSCILVFVMMCGVLPVAVHAEDGEPFTLLCDRSIYLHMNESFTIPCEYSGSAPTFQLQERYLTSGEDWSLAEWDGLTVTALDFGFGYETYSILIDGYEVDSVTIYVYRDPTEVIIHNSRDVYLLGQHSEYLSVETRPEGARFAPVTVSSSNEDVISMTGKTMYFMNTGTAVITASSGNVQSDPVSLEVIDGNYVSSIGIKEDFNSNLYAGDAIASPFELYAESGSFEDDTIVYESDDESVATVDPATGEITAVSAGSAMITVTTDYMGPVSVPVYVYEKISSLGFTESEYTCYTDTWYSLKDWMNIEPAEAYNNPLVYSSSDTDIVSIDSNGQMYFNSAGDTVITVWDEENPDMSSQCTVHAVNPADINVTMVTDHMIYLNRGESFEPQFEGLGDETPEFRVNREVGNYEFELVSVDGSLFTAQYDGYGYVTYEVYVNGNYVDKFTIFVSQNEPEELWFESDRDQLWLRWGETELTLGADPAGSQYSHLTVSSTDENVIRPKEGEPFKFELVGTGTADIIYTAESGYSISKTVEVVEGNYIEEVFPENDIYDYYLKPGETMPSKAVFNYSSENYDDDTIEYYVSDDDIAAVDPQTGEVTAVSPGECVLYIRTAFLHTNLYTIHVADELQSMQFTKDSYTGMLYEGESVFNMLSLEPATARYNQFIFTSSDPEVVMIGSSGYMSYWSPGEAVITVQYVNDPSMTAQCTVQVTDEYVPDVSLLGSRNIYLEAGESTVLEFEGLEGRNPVFIPADSDTMYGEPIVFYGTEASALPGGSGYQKYNIYVNDNYVDSVNFFVYSGEPESMSLDTPVRYLLIQEGSVRIRPDIMPETARYAPITLESSDENVLRPSAESPYVFDIVGAGTAVISGVTYNGVPASVEYEVLDGNYGYGIELADGITEYTMKAGEPMDSPVTILSYTGSYEDDTITYSTDNPDVISVDPETGAAIALNPGTAMVYVNMTVGSFGAYTVNVTEETESIRFTEESYTLIPGDSNNLKDIMIFEPETSRYNQYTFTSSDSSVVEVNYEGYYWCHEPGEAVITVAYADNPLIVAQCTIQVIDPETAEVKMLSPRHIYMEAHDSMNLEFEGLYGRTPRYVYAGNDYYSDGDGLVYIDGTYVDVYPGAYGWQSFDIYVSDKYVDTVNFYVRRSEPEDIYFDISSRYLFKRNGQVRIVPEITPSTARYSPLTFTSSDENVLRQSEESPYLFDIVGTGTAEITAAISNGASASFEFEVLDGDYAEGIWLKDGVSEYYLKPEGSMDSPVIINAPTGSYGDDTITYYTDDPDIISVDSQTGAVTALRTGATNVWVSMTVGSFFAYTVNVSQEPEYIQFTESSYTRVPDNNENISNLIVYEPESSRYSSYTYTSSNSDVVSISSDGYYWCNMPGEAVITVTYTENPTITAQCTITVIDPSDLDVKLLSDPVIKLQPGETFDLEFEGLNGMTPSFSREYFDSYSPVSEVVSIDGTQIIANDVEGIEAYEITVAGQIIDTIWVYVYTELPESLSFENAPDKLLWNYQTSLSPAISPYKGRYYPVTLTSDNEDVIRPSSDNPRIFEVTGPGIAIVTASTDTGLYAEHTVEVLDGEYAVSAFIDGLDSYFTMLAGQTMNSPFSIEANNEAGSYSDDVITYVSTDPSVAAVDLDTGKVTAVAPGTAEITAYGVIGYLGSYTVTVTEPVRSIRFTKDAYNGEPRGSDYILNFLETDPANVPANQFDFSSSNPSVANVNEYGWMNYGQYGEAVITVTYKLDPSINAQCTVYIIDPYSVKFRFVNESPISLKPGETAVLEYEVTGTTAPPEFRMTYSQGGYTGYLIQIDGNTVTATSTGYGKAEIGAYYGDVNVGNIEVVVADDPTSINFWNSSESVLLRNGTYRAHVSIAPYSAHFAKLIYSSSNNSVIRPVNETSAEFELVSPGTAKLYAETPDGSVRAEMDITVLDGDFIESIELNEDAGFIKVGDTVDKPFKFYPEGNTYADDHITYISSDPDIVEFDENGRLIAHKAGKASIAVYTELYPNGSIWQAMVYETPKELAFEKDSYSISTEEYGANLNLVSDVAIDNNLFVWTSTNTDAATVFPGYVSRQGTGTTTIRATFKYDSSIYAETTVTIYEAVPAEQITADDVYIGYPDYYVAIIPKIMPETAPQQFTVDIQGNDDGIVYYNPRESTVSYSADILGVKPGTVSAVISTPDGSSQTSAEIRIVEGKPEIKEFKLNIFDENRFILNDQETDRPSEYTLIKGKAYIFGVSYGFGVSDVHHRPKQMDMGFGQRMDETGMFQEGGVIYGGSGVGSAFSYETNAGSYAVIYTAKEAGTVTVEVVDGHEVTFHIVDPEEFPENMVARIAGVPYTDLQSAVDAVKDGECITIMTDEPLSAEVNKTVTFRIENGANVTLTEGRRTTLTSFVTKYPGARRTPISYYTYEKEDIVLVKHQAVEATCEEAGNSEYWEDEESGKYYSDEAGLNEIEANSWITPAIGHAYYPLMYTWYYDRSSVTATAVCEHDSSHILTEKAETTSVTTATCEEAGKIIYTASFTNDIFEDQTQEVSVPATGHAYQVNKWAWADDFSTASVKLVCANDSAHTVTVEAEVTVTETAPTAAVPGYIEYTATVEYDDAVYTDVKGEEIPVESPTIVTVTTDTATGRPSVVWQTRQCAVKYQLYRSTEENGSYAKITEGTGTSYLDTDAEAGTEYFYKVRCVGTDGKAGEYSEPVSITAIPSQPTGITTKNNPATGNIKISWDDMEDAYKYQVYRATSSSGTYTRIGTTEANQYIDTTGENGQTYYYKVRSVTENNVYSKYSSKKSAKCSETELTLTAVIDTASGSPVLSWNTAEEIKYYQLYRSESEDGTYTKVTNTTNTSKTDSTAEAGKTYWYKVRVIDTDSKSGSYSEPVSITAIPSQPTGITTKNNPATGNIRISWDEMEDAYKYQVYRATSSNGTYTRIATTENAYYVDTKGESGKTYYYKVRSVTENSVYSKYSSKKSAKCSETILTIKASTDTATGKPKLTWNTAEEIRYYQLYRSESEDGTYTKLGNMTVTTKVDSTAETGKTYWYKVRVIDTNSKSGSYSEPVSIVCKPGKVTGLKATVVSSTGKPKLTWTAVEDAAKYQVYYSTSKTGTYKRLATTANTSYTHTGAAADTTYYYKVRAVSENGTYGTFSSIVTNPDGDIMLP